MNEGGTLLFRRESVEEIKESDLVILLFFLLVLAVQITIANALSLYDNSSAIGRFVEGQHIVEGAKV